MDLYAIIFWNLREISVKVGLLERENSDFLEKLLSDLAANGISTVQYIATPKAMTASLIAMTKLSMKLRPDASNERTQSLPRARL